MLAPRAKQVGRPRRIVDRDRVLRIEAGGHVAARHRRQAGPKNPGHTDKDSGRYPLPHGPTCATSSALPYSTRRAKLFVQEQRTYCINRCKLGVKACRVYVDISDGPAHDVATKLQTGYGTVRLRLKESWPKSAIPSSALARGAISILILWPCGPASVLESWHQRWISGAENHEVCFG